MINSNMFLQQESEASVLSNPINSSQPTGHQRKLSISISMPSSPRAASSTGTKSVFFVDDNAKGFRNGVPDSSLASKTLGNIEPKAVKFLSQPMPKGSNFGETANIRKLKDKRFDSFKTWSGKLERQLSNLRGKPRESEPEEDSVRNSENEALPVHRYFDALEGPELETLRVCAHHLPPILKPNLLFILIIHYKFAIPIHCMCLKLKNIVKDSVLQAKYFSCLKNLTLFILTGFGGDCASR